MTCTGLEFSFAFSTKYVFFPQENIFHKKKLVLNKARLPWKCHKETQVNSYIVFLLLGFSCMFIQEIIKLDKKQSDPTDRCCNISLHLSRFLN